MKSILNDYILSELKERIKDTHNRLILLDFDGTLVEFKADIAAVVPSRQLLILLKKIATASENQLIIITGRREDDIDRLVGHLPIVIIAEHGAMIRENRIWRTLLEGTSYWKNEVLPLMREYCSLTPDSFIEEKHFSLAWHFRNADRQTGKNNAIALTSALKKVALHNDLRVLYGGKVVEILSKNVNKGAATQYLLNKSYDFILSIGDGKTDEDMFNVLLNNRNAFTFKIGQGNTCAKYKLKDIEQVINLLKNLLAEVGLTGT